ncbi:hypothetical protein IMCC1989_1903 [gamma proteobacterium IMCC1989]|nr:hypothetical protein IMCC1989_1903 [gamma proteobacterium IMCC1989]
MSEVIQSKTKAFIHCAIPFLMLGYFLFGALSEGIVIPGREGSLALLGISAWLACLFPLLWLTGDLIRHYPNVPMSTKARNMASTILTVVGALIFFYATTM